MRLDDVLAAALTEMGYGVDSQSLDAYRDKLTVYVNEAVRDLAKIIKPTFTESVDVTDGKVGLFSLSKSILEVLSVTVNGKDVRWGSSDYGFITVDDPGPVDIKYAYYPADIIDELPYDVGACTLIPLYVVGRLRMSGDSSSQNSAGYYIQRYNSEKYSLLPHFGEPDNYEIGFKNAY